MRDGGLQRLQEDEDRWNAQSEEMVGRARWIAINFKPFPQFTHQLFVRSDLKPLNQEDWDAFIARNSGKLPAEVAAWEKWDVFPDRTAASRYYGFGTDEVVGKIQGALWDGGDTLKEYEEFSVPKCVEWILPSSPRPSHGERLPDHYRLVELISRQMGVQGVGQGVGWRELGLESFTVDDFASAAVEAIYDWIPDGPYRLDDEEEAKPADDAPRSPYRFHFNERSQRWELSFPGDPDGEFENLTGLLFYSKMLKKPRESVTADDLYEIDRTKLGPKSKPDEAITEDGLEYCHNKYDRLTDELAVAREKGDTATVDALVKKCNELQDAIKRDINPRTGRSKFLLGREIKDPPRAAERALRYAIEALMDKKRRMNKLASYLQRTCTKISATTWQYEPKLASDWTTDPDWEF
ncbi:MAG: hypothetical protein GXY83_34180 [Rhodopirellula sp.]|nr:hypothetical protein [Rhodopirellula sp.]